MKRSTLSVFWFAIVIGCSNGDSEPTGIDARADVIDSGSGEADAQPDAAVVVDAGSSPPGTPVLLSASLVAHGTMALAWQNPASTCATVEINRKKDAGAYSVAQTLTGQATSAQDSPGHTSGTFCYTITCKLGGLASSPPNQTIAPH